MVMDPRLRGFTDSIKINPDQNLINFFKPDDHHHHHHHHQYLVPNFGPGDWSPNTVANMVAAAAYPESRNSAGGDDDSPEDCDFSDTVLRYISQMLMEEDMEEKNCMFQESSALQAAERPFYEILHPTSPDQHPLDRGEDSPVEGYNNSSSGSSSSSNSNNSNHPADAHWNLDVIEQKPSQSSQSQSLIGDYYTFQSRAPHSSFNGVIGMGNDWHVDSPGNKFYLSDLYGESQSLFHKGVEEASKFLPNSENLILDSLYQLKKEEQDVDVDVDVEVSPNGSRGKKNVHRVELDLEDGRSNKQSAVSTTDDDVRTEMFDMVLLCQGKQVGCDDATKLREAMKSEMSKNLQHNNGQQKGGNGGKTRGGKKQGGKKDVVDLRTLLIHCAQSVAADDRRGANELLKQIKQHSSPFGDGNQRLAQCFAEGLEARLAGTGSQVYNSLVNKKTTAAIILKAYHLFLSACPFKKLSNFFANQTIMNMAENATRLHIIDFGVLYGFQWPCLIQRLSARAGGPPSLKITGIDFPQPGFRPAERVEETGRRLSNYAESFNVPFKYNAIAKKWETIQIEDLKIEPDELLVVNCMYRMRNLLDETVVLDSPRNAVLNLIRKTNPAVFIHGVVNGSYNAPFFITRFREALFHYSALFDMLETNVPREHPERILIEREILGREAISVIACEGSERVERPETYKQWQIRSMRAGFQPLPLNPEIMKKAKDRVKMSYHKDFVIDEDSQWMLQGWKGRIVYATTAWKPVDR
ncbi:hypothetical protein Sjap_013557 [Stephania japonica]|uniref:Scarecrow-like protein 9 n=1 Tax=Stephania japonica TaxID=461633 RepID=A0AAP0P020_9MAGN